MSKVTILLDYQDLPTFTKWKLSDTALNLGNIIDVPTSILTAPKAFERKAVNAFMLTFGEALFPNTYRAIIKQFGEPDHNDDNKMCDPKIGGNYIKNYFTFGVSCLEDWCEEKYAHTGLVCKYTTSDHNAAIQEIKFETEYNIYMAPLLKKIRDSLPYSRVSVEQM